MFIKIKDSQNQSVLLNTEKIEAVVRQTDGDVFIYMADGHHYKAGQEAFDRLEQL